jgi:hypothetical protein
MIWKLKGRKWKFIKKLEVQEMKSFANHHHQWHYSPKQALAFLILDLHSSLSCAFTSKFLFHSIHPSLLNRDCKALVVENNRTLHDLKSWSSFHALDRFQHFHPSRGLESDFLVNTFLLGGGGVGRVPAKPGGILDTFCLAPKLWPVWHGRTYQQLRCRQHSSPLQIGHAIPPPRKGSVSGRGPLLIFAHKNSKVTPIPCNKYIKCKCSQ